MPSKSHFHKKDCALSLILKVRVFGTRKWPIKTHFKDQPISKLLSHYSAVPEPAPTSQEQRTTSKPWTPTPPGIICNTSACTDISQGWCLKHFNFALRSPCKRASALRVHSLWLSYYSKGYSAPLRAVRARVEWNSSFIDIYWVCRAVWYFKTQTDLMSLQCMRVYYDNKYYLHKTKSRPIAWSSLIHFYISIVS